MTTETQSFETTLETLGLGQGWNWSNGSWWKDCTEGFDPRAHAAQLLALGARFIAITATEKEDGEVRLDYQWDLSGKLLSFTTSSQDKKIATIADLTPAADWVERETWEYFAVEFTGRETMLPLMTRPGDTPGVNLRKDLEVAQ